jgi:hypothetical protein
MQLKAKIGEKASIAFIYLVLCSLNLEIAVDRSFSAKEPNGYR